MPSVLQWRLISGRLLLRLQPLVANFPVLIPLCQAESWNMASIPEHKAAVNALQRKSVFGESVCAQRAAFRHDLDLVLLAMSSVFMNQKYGSSNQERKSCNLLQSGLPQKTRAGAIVEDGKVAVSVVTEWTTPSRVPLSNTETMHNTAAKQKRQRIDRHGSQGQMDVSPFWGHAGWLTCFKKTMCQENY